MSLRAWMKGRPGAASRLNADDIVVFVVGPTGSGKSSFIHTVTKSDFVKVGNSLHPKTMRVHAIRCELTENARSTLGATTQKNIVFVDTPSFHTMTMESDKGEREMSSWLNHSKCNSTLVGTIYMHRVETDPRVEPIRIHLNAFAATFPEGFTSFPRRLHAILTYEGLMPLAKTESRVMSLRMQLDELAHSRTKRDEVNWQTSLHPRLFRVGDSETAWEAVVALFSDFAGRYGMTEVEQYRPTAKIKQANNAVETQTKTNQSHEEAEESPASVKTEDLNTDDIVIAIMGPVGAGKSTFIRSASGRETQGTGNSLELFTDEILSIRFRDEKSRRYVVLVDTPGFSGTHKSDYEILGMISDWLNKSYGANKFLSAILYFHRITDDRMAGVSLKNLRLLQKLCGREALETVYLTTTMWDDVNLDVGEKRLIELSTQYWKDIIDRGSQIVRCRIDDDSHKMLIRRIIDQEMVHKAVQPQEEMGEARKDSATWQQLFFPLEMLIEKRTEIQQRIENERKTGSETNALEVLQKEYDELLAQIDDKTRQLQELKLPWFKSSDFPRFRSRRQAEGGLRFNKVRGT